MAPVRRVALARMPRGYGTRPKEIRPGYWVAQVSLGRHPDGSRDRRAVIGRTADEVVAKVAKVQHRRVAGSLPASDVKLVEHLVAKYAETHAALARSTWARYEGAYRLYVLPGLGKHKIDTLTHTELNRFFAACRCGPLAPGMAYDEPVKDSTVNNIKIALGSLFEFAVASGYASRNIVRMAATIPVDSRPAYELTDAQVVSLLRACGGHASGSLLEAIVFQALREAEAFGLRWRDIDWEHDQINIRRQVRSETGLGRVASKPKWGSSRKEIPLMRAARHAFERRRAEQMAQKAAGLANGKPWSDSEYVFTTPTGEPLYPNFAWRAFREICDAAAIPCRPTQGEHLTIGDLRHNGARVQRRSGTRIEVIAKLLGHSRTSTSETYLGLTNFAPTAMDVAAADDAFAELQARARSGALPTARETAASYGEPPTKA